MSNLKSHRTVQELNRRGKLSEKSSSFHGRLPVSRPTEKQLRRPETLPDLLQDRSLISVSQEPQPKKLTKLLLNVTIQGSVGAVQLVISPETTVSDLIVASVRQYVRECRRPILPTTDPSGFDLHYSQFSLESLSREEKLMDLGSRNFFLCSKKSVAECSGDETMSSSSTCSTEAEKTGKIGIPCLNFIDFLL